MVVQLRFLSHTIEVHYHEQTLSAPTRKFQKHRQTSAVGKTVHAFLATTTVLLEVFHSHFESQQRSIFNASKQRRTTLTEIAYTSTNAGSKNEVHEQEHQHHHAHASDDDFILAAITTLHGNHRHRTAYSPIHPVRRKFEKSGGLPRAVTGAHSTCLSRLG